MYDLKAAAEFATLQLDVTDLEQIVYESTLKTLQEQSPVELEKTFAVYKKTYNYIPKTLTLEEESNE